MLAALTALALSCGVDRWEIKTLADDAGHIVSLWDADYTTVENLVAVKRPEWHADMERQPTESAVYYVDAMLIAYKHETPPQGDDDYHLVLMGVTGKTLVAEIPSPVCVPAWHHDQAARVRADFLRLVPRAPTSKLLLPETPIAVRVTGVPFWDKIHGQAGVADNGLEIHPVLAIERIP